MLIENIFNFFYIISFTTRFSKIDGYSSIMETKVRLHALINVMSEFAINQISFVYSNLYVGMHLYFLMRINKTINIFTQIRNQTYLFIFNLQRIYICIYHCMIHQVLSDNVMIINVTADKLCETILNIAKFIRSINFSGSKYALSLSERKVIIMEATRDRKKFNFGLTCSKYMLFVLNFIFAVSSK